MTYLQDTLALGTTVGHFRIVRSLGRGGMGEVYLALDTRLQRDVALKVLSRDLLLDRERVQLLDREARALAALNHPNIVTIFEIEEAGGAPVLVMEFVEGQTLRTLIAREGLPLDRFYAVAVPLADALAAAHEQGVTHRDLKPENVMVNRNGRIKVLDFGLAKIAARPDVRPGPGPVSEGAVQTLAQSGVMVGTVPYMSPEQVESLPVDSRSDIFSLGIVLFEMLVGYRPFQGDSTAGVISSVLRDTPPSLSTLRSDVPADLARVVRRCLHKDPESRYQSARDVHIELRELAEELRTPAGSGRGVLPTPVPGSAWNSLSRVVRGGQSIRTRTGAALLLGGIALVNWIETTLETWVTATTGAGVGLREDFARAMLWLEGGLTFERHELTSAVSIYGYSAVYFFVMPLLVLLALAGFARRADSRPFRVTSFALAFDYVISMPFYLLFTIPERWAFPESDAILLSDVWSSRLVDLIRPISAIDNCFPSFHVSATVIVLLAAFRFEASYRTLTVPVALAVMASTFALGIHWIADIVAGVAVGVLSVWFATKADARLAGPPADGMRDPAKDNLGGRSLDGTMPFVQTPSS